MRDSKAIIFTKHAKQRSYERGLGHYIVLMDRFKKAFRFAEGFWVNKFIDDEDTVYVVEEKPDRFIVVTVYKYESPLISPCP